MLYSISVHHVVVPLTYTAFTVWDHMLYSISVHHVVVPLTAFVAVHNGIVTNYKDIKQFLVRMYMYM